MSARLENGLPAAGFFWRIPANVSGVNPIALSWTARTWVRLVQFTANWEPDVPVTSENITLWKDHASTEFDVVLKSFDPSAGALNLKDLVCNDVFYFEPGEIARVDYPNSDGNDVGVELYFERLDRKP